MEDGAKVQVVGGGGGGGAAVIRDLASCNKSTRDRALKHVLKTWLPSRQPDQVSDDDMKKLWKGLFYCVWHADKAPVQLDLINRLSSLLLTLDLSLSLDYLAVFFLTMRREWTGIDSLRLDKFYLLIRRFLHSSFLMLKKNYCWDLEPTRRFMAILEEKTFFADDKFLGNGVNYHIASIFLDELKPFLPIRSEVVDVIFKPFLRVMLSCQDKVLLGKVKSNVFDVMLKSGKSLLELKKLGDEDASATGSENNDVVALGTIALTMGFSAKFYDLGTSPDCLQGNRKVLFSLHEDFMRLEKDLESAGIEISIPDAMVDEEDEVPQLIPIAAVTEAKESASDDALQPVSGSKPGKKNKKANKESDRSSENAEEMDRPNNKALNKKKKKKKKEKNKNRNQSIAVKENGDAIIANGENSTNETIDGANNLIFNESVISNLQMQFEKVAAEVALDKDGSGSCDLSETTVTTTVAKKRKRAKTTEGQDPNNVNMTSEDDCGCDAANSTAKSLENSAKKVRFSMKNNLVWKPHSPLPPQSLRIPPSVTPRGSALKKGIPPGPIMEMPPATKKVKQKKKARKGMRVTPAIKRLRKLQTLGI